MSLLSVAPDKNWTLDQSDGTLTLHTGVTGRAARMGHRLTILMNSWQISVDWAGKKPVAASLVVDVDAFEVQSGEGGLTPLSGPEKGIVRSNALKTLDAKHFPTIEFRTENISATPEGYRLTGTLQIHGVVKPAVVDLTARQDDAGWELGCTAEVSHKEFGIKPYSMAMGAMKVADVVTVSFTAHHA